MTMNERQHAKADEANVNIVEGIAEYDVWAFREEEDPGEIRWWIDPPYKHSEVRGRPWRFWLDVEGADGGTAEVRLSMTRDDIEPMVKHLVDAMGYSLEKDADKPEVGGGD